MGILERVNSLKQGGLSESQITSILKEEGVSPQQISDAFSQSKIKAAVAAPAEVNEELSPSIMQEANSKPRTIEQGSMPIPAPTPTPVQEVPQQVQQAYQEPQYQQPQQYQQAYAQDYSQGQQTYDPNAQQGYYDPNQQAAYDPNAQQGYYDPNQQAAYDPNAAYYTQTVDLDTVRMVAKQQVEESLKKVREDMNAIIKLKTDLKFELQDMENRLTKIENVMQELQTAIIRKMADYGESISGISREVRATQESFSKVINPLIDKKRGTNQEEYTEEKTSSEEKNEEAQVKHKTKKAPEKQLTRSPSDGFEGYFR